MKKIQWLWLMLLMALTSCSATRITSSWKADSIPVQKYNKIMVVALMQQADRIIHEKMENHFVGDLKALGYNAVSSMQEYGPKAFDKMNEQEVLDKLKNSRVDAVITVVLLDKERERRYVPGNIRYTPFGYYHNRFWRYYGTMQTRIYEPGYYVTDTKYFWESNFYEMKDQTLLYSAQTRSFDPANSESLAHENGQTIIKDMVKKNMLQQQ